MLINHTKFHVNWLNTFENRGGGPIDPPLMHSCNFFFFMRSRVKQQQSLRCSLACVATAEGRRVGTEGKVRREIES